MSELVMDRELSRRIERAEGGLGTSFIPVQQRVDPALGAEWRDFAGTYALYVGADSPMTQTFGLGMFAPVTAELLAEIEAFFAERGAPTMHEVSPHAGVDALALLVSRGYRPIELSSVVVLPLVDRELPPSSLRVRIMEPADRAAWVDTSVAGWSDQPGLAGIIRQLADVASQNTEMVHFLAERDGEPVGSSSLGIQGDIALFAGASTVASARGLGAQSLMLAARVTEARKRGCTLGLMAAEPGSTSQRNAERRGFRIAYTRTKWRREA